MRIFVVTSIYPPEPTVSGRICAEIAGALAGQGHFVIVVTAFPSRPSGKPYRGYKRVLVHREKVSENLELIRCFSIPSPRSTLLSRLLENLSFGLISSLVVLVLQKADVIYANTWPIVASGILTIITKLRHIPLITNVQDMYPESLVSEGKLPSNHLLVKWILEVDKLIANNSRALVVISERFATIYKEDRLVPTNKIKVIPNWAEPNTGYNEDDSEALRQELGVSSQDKLFVYGGNIGAAAGVETIIIAFGMLSDIADIHLLIAGEGTQLSACKNLARAIPESKISFYSPWPQHKTSTVLRAAQIFLLPTRSNQALASVPSKLPTYMLYGKPVLSQSVQASDIAIIIERAMCGWVIPPDDPELLAATIRRIYQLPPRKLSAMGQSGRQYALRHLTSKTLLPKVVKIIQETAMQSQKTFG